MKNCSLHFYCANSSMFHRAAGSIVSFIDVAGAIAFLSTLRCVGLRMYLLLLEVGEVQECSILVYADRS